MNVVVIMPYGREDSNKKYLAKIPGGQYLLAGTIVVYTNPSGYESVGVTLTGNFTADETVQKLWGADSGNIKTVVAELYRHDFKEEESEPEVPEVAEP